MKPRHITLFSLAVSLLAGCAPDTGLEKRLADVNAQLEELPKLKPNMLCPTIGFGSALFQDPNHATWLDIILPEPRKIDTIVLSPALIKDEAGELVTLGFPLRFSIETWMDESPAAQCVRISDGGWIYQPIGTYDPAIHPNELVCELSSIQPLGGAGSSPISVSLFGAQHFEPANSRDLLHAPGVTQIGETQTHPSWAEWSTITGKHVPQLISARFELQNVPAGTTLYLRIAQAAEINDVVLNNIRVSSPFALKNGNFETPALTPNGIKADLSGWYYRNVLQLGTHWIAPSFSRGKVVVDYTQEDFPNPGAAPVVFTLPSGTMAHKVRIRVSCLEREKSWRESNKGHLFALNEILLFDGLENVALNSRTACGKHRKFPLMFHSDFAVDGYTYFPPVDPKEVSSPEHESIDTQQGMLLFDLGKICSFDEMHFYPVDRSPQFSHLFAMGIGFPSDITLRVSDEPNPDTARTVLNLKNTHPIAVAPLMHRFKQQSGRYIWLEMSGGQLDPRTRAEALGLSEIQLFQAGTNVLAGVLPLQPADAQQKLSHLTDGRTSSGIIMPQKEWLLKLNQRAVLERERAALVLQQQHRAEKLDRLLRWLRIAIPAALLTVFLIILVIRYRHRCHLRQLREKIGANLHDQVGANLFSIAMSSETLEHTCLDDSPKTRRLITNIQRVASETATEIRLLSRFLEKRGVENNLIGQLRRIENQLLPRMQTTVSYDAPEKFNALPPIDKWELVLFFKEALTNIGKHADATHVHIQTWADDRLLQLEIKDDGKGLPDQSDIPVHLKKRAEKICAKLHIDSSPETGTSIRLTISQKQRRMK